MKKRSLILGILLVSSIAYGKKESGEDIANRVVEKLKEKSSWSFKGSKIKYEINLLNSETKAVESGKEEDFKLKLSKNIDEVTDVSFKWDSDDSDPDTNVEMYVKRKFYDTLEAQMEMDIDVESGVKLSEKEDSHKTYIKYMPSNSKISFIFYPYSMNMEVGDEFETGDFIENLDGEIILGTANVPGIVSEYKISNDLEIGFGLGTVTLDDDDNNEVSRLGYVIKGEYKSSDFSTKLKISGNLEKNDDEKDELAILNSSASLISELEIGKLGFESEILITTINSGVGIVGKNGGVVSDTDYAFMLKSEYNLGRKKGMKIVPYLEYKYIGEYVYFDDDDSAFGEVDIISDELTIDDSYHGGLGLIAMGTDFKIDGGFTLTPEIEFGKSGENGYYENDKGENKDSMYKLSFIAEYKFK